MLSKSSPKPRASDPCTAWTGCNLFRLRRLRQSPASDSSTSLICLRHCRHEWSTPSVRAGPWRAQNGIDDESDMLRLGIDKLATPDEQAVPSCGRCHGMFTRTTRTVKNRFLGFLHAGIFGEDSRDVHTAQLLPLPPMRHLRQQRRRSVVAMTSRTLLPMGLDNSTPHHSVATIVATFLSRFGIACAATAVPDKLPRSLRFASWLVRPSVALRLRIQVHIASMSR